MPAIIRSMNIATSYETQLLTVPGKFRQSSAPPSDNVVYFVAAVSFLIIAHFSDKYQMRAPFMCIAWGFLIIGYILLATTKAAAPRYVGVFIVSAGLYIVPGLNVSQSSVED
jgi:NADH:ubiquinone oxidoreductase subunit 2 (subunit N)